MNTSRLKAKEPLFFASTRKEERKQLGAYNREMGEDPDPLHVTEMSQRRLKKLWERLDRGGRAHGASERRQERRWAGMELRAIDEAMLRNAY